MSRNEGNRCQTTFFNKDDYQMYITLMAGWCSHHEVTVWAYCLMPNHTHLIAVPLSQAALREAIGEVDRRYRCEQPLTLALSPIWERRDNGVGDVRTMRVLDGFVTKFQTEGQKHN